VQRCKNLPKKSIFNAAKTFAIFKGEKNKEGTAMAYGYLRRIICGYLLLFLFLPGAFVVPRQEG
jgi:hypothetical protein